MTTNSDRSPQPFMKSQESMMKSKQQGLTAHAPARALPDDDEPTIGDLQRELARLRLSRDTWKTRAQKAARRLIDALPDHAATKAVTTSIAPDQNLDKVAIDVQCRCGRTHHLEMPAGEFSVRLSEPGAEG